MNAAAPAAGSQRNARSDQSTRRREVLTPEGLAMPLLVASRGARAGALLLDLLIVTVTLIALLLAMIALGLSLFRIEAIFDNSPALELLGVILVMTLFLARYGYFLWFELGPRGATPGKRLLGIRVAARPLAGGAGGRLTAEAVIARNLMRDVEVFLPLTFLLGGGYESGVMGLAAAAWLGIFVLLPCFNRDNLRAGDIVGGTWVVEANRVKLPSALSLAPDRQNQYRFGEAELSVYGEHELQVLEDVLRQDDAEMLRDVTETICGKIGWQAGTGDERAFLEAFYAALRAHLERGMRFGRRKSDKFS